MLRLIFAVFALFTVIGLTQPEETSSFQEVKHPKRDYSKPYTPQIFLNFGLIRKIMCADTKSDDSFVGTGFIIQRGMMVTAAHVLDGQCIDTRTGSLLTVVTKDHVNDVAVLSFNDGSSPQTHYFPYSCEGFKKHQHYSALGYPFGGDLIMTKLVDADDKLGPADKLSNDPADGMEVLYGDIIEGMSGGPVIDDNGVAVGINSGTNHEGIGFSRALKDAGLCQSALK